MDRIYLRWFRDKGNGQLACDVTGALEIMDGIWPVAIIEFATQEQAAKKWHYLYYAFGVNATTVTECNYYRNLYHEDYRESSHV